MIIRRKGVAIIDSSRGILVVAGRDKKFILPGGGAEKWESRKKATIREVYEETHLKTKSIKFIFSYIGNKWHNSHGKIVINHTKVFLVKAEGSPKPKNEIKYINYYQENSKIGISGGTKRVIEKYLREYK